MGARSAWLGRTQACGRKRGRCEGTCATGQEVKCGSADKQIVRQKPRGESGQDGLAFNSMVQRPDKSTAPKVVTVFSAISSTAISHQRNQLLSHVRTYIPAHICDFDWDCYDYATAPYPVFVFFASRFISIQDPIGL